MSLVMATEKIKEYRDLNLHAKKAVAFSAEAMEAAKKSLLKE